MCGDEHEEEILQDQRTSAMGCAQLLKIHYLASAPWKQAKMKRREFEALLLEMPDGFTEYVFKEAEVERLVEAVFGKGSLE